MPRTARCTTARHAVVTGSKNPLVDPRAGAPVASGAMISTTRTPGALTVGPLRPVILKLAAPAVAMMACDFCFILLDAIWVGRLTGPAALAAVSTAGFYVWVLLSLGEMVEVGLIAVAARRHGEGLPDAAARAAGAAVVYALAAGTVVSLRYRRGRGALRRAKSGGARLHRHLRVRALGLRPRGTEPGRAAGGARPPGGADDRGLLSGGHNGHRGRLPHDPEDARRPVHPRSRGDCGWQPVPAGDRVRADRPNVRDHSGRCARRGGVHAVAPNRQHHAHPPAGAARRVVVERHWARRDLAGALRHRCRARDRHGHVLAQRRLAARHGLTTVATLITLLTDFGSADSYVGEEKGVLWSQVHGAALVDITHQVPPGDVRAAQYILSRVWHRFPQGSVHLAVVDPGVGTDRRVLAASTAGHLFGAPDNGLLPFLPPHAHFR